MRLTIITIASVLIGTGILEKLSFNASCNVAGTLDGKQVDGYMAADCVLGNTIGLLLAITFAALVVTIWHANHKPDPFLVGEESSPLISGGPKNSRSVDV